MECERCERLSKQMQQWLPFTANMDGVAVFVRNRQYNWFEPLPFQARPGELTERCLGV